MERFCWWKAKVEDWEKRAKNGVKVGEKKKRGARPRRSAGKGERRKGQNCRMWESNLRRPASVPGTPLGTGRKGKRDGRSAMARGRDNKQKTNRKQAENKNKNKQEQQVPATQTPEIRAVGTGGRGCPPFTLYPLPLPLAHCSSASYGHQLTHFLYTGARLHLCCRTMPREGGGRGGYLSVQAINVRLLQHSHRLPPHHTSEPLFT